MALSIIERRAKKYINRAQAVYLNTTGQVRDHGKLSLKSFLQVESINVVHFPVFISLIDLEYTDIMVLSGEDTDNIQSSDHFNKQR